MLTATDGPGLGALVESGVSAFREAGRGLEFRLEPEDVGRVRALGSGVAELSGLPGAVAEELLRFPGGRAGIVFNLEPGRVSVVLLDRAEMGGIRAGTVARRTGRVLDVPVGEELLGRVVDPLGRPLDGRGRVRSSARMAVEQPAPAITARAPVEVPLLTGILAVDALVPIGRGQRELVVGDRQTGKTAVTLDAILNQRESGVVSVYCSIGQPRAAVARVVATLREHDAAGRTIVVVAAGDDPPGLRYAAPYAAMTMAEFFRDRGRDALVVFDDLTRHARSYRELSLLLRRPPAREAYPGDIFYVHSRLLERATHLNDDHGGGSLTALPVIETQAENISAYIPTNLVSITDGQVYLSPRLFHEGLMPAIDIGRSVSRVGGRTQFPAFHGVAGGLKLAYSQFRELESFSRFGTRLDEKTRQALRRGRRVREVLKQAEHELIPPVEQVALLVAVNEGLFDPVPLDRMAGAVKRVRKLAREELAELARDIEQGEELSDERREAVTAAARKALEELAEGEEGKENEGTKGKDGRGGREGTVRKEQRERTDDEDEERGRRNEDGGLRNGE